jgi:hypothetical protein
MSHVYHPRTVEIDVEKAEEQLATNEPLLFDGCPDCETKINPLLQSPALASILWVKMIRVDFRDVGRYRSDNEARAGLRLYELAVFAERNLGLTPTEDGLERLVQVR